MSPAYSWFSLAYSVFPAEQGTRAFFSRKGFFDQQTVRKENGNTFLLEVTTSVIGKLPSFTRFFFLGSERFLIDQLLFSQTIISGPLSTQKGRRRAWKNISRLWKIEDFAKTNLMKTCVPG